MDEQLHKERNSIKNTYIKKYYINHFIILHITHDFFNDF